MIRFENVSKVYGSGFKAVDNVSFSLQKGEVLVLIGPSGCGKTTTMKMVNRLLDPTEGKIYVEGKDISGVDPIQLRLNIGYVIQEIGLFPHMTVGENIGLVPTLKKWLPQAKEERINELLLLCGLSPDFKDKYPYELSGGQRQRVGVARALAADPPILLMDEPFGALDPITRVLLQDEFLKIQEKMKKTVVFVTHDMGEALRVGDKIAIMNLGRIIQFDTREEILKNPANEFVEKFVGTDRILKYFAIKRVKEGMIKDVITLNVNQDLEEIREYLLGEEVDNLAVVDDRGVLQGQILLKDIVKMSAKGKVGQIVRPVPLTIQEDASLSEALVKMLENNVDSLPVLDSKGMVRGVITLSSFHKLVGKSVLN